MASSDAMAFMGVFCIVFFVNLFAPIISEGFGEEMDTRTVEDIDPTAPPSTSVILNFTILNILLVPFWTIGMPFYMNLIIMIPLRVLGWILILRLIRGN